MKKLFFLGILFGALNSNAQNIPTVISYEIDTMCSDSYGHGLLYNIVVKDLDADSTYLTVMSFDGGDLANVEVISPPFIPGDTLRTFTILADAGTGLSPGLNISDIGVDVIGNTGPDGGAGFTFLPAYIYGYINVNFNMDAVSMCENGHPFDMRPYASPAGGTFSWGDEDSYMLDPHTFVSSGVGGVYYYYQNPAGCVGYNWAAPGSIHTEPIVNFSVVNSNCGTPDGSITPSITSGTAPYMVYWSTGFSELVSGAPSNLTALSPGNYYANITDANGCKAVGLAQISDLEISISEIMNQETCMFSSQDGGIDLTITPSIGTVNYIHWSNGQMTEDLTNVHKGEYLVEIRTDNGCEANRSYFVGAAPSLYAQNVNSIDAFCSNSDGMIDIDIFDGSGDYTFLWNTGATTEELMGIPSGSYSCLITDNITGCTTTFSYDIYSMDGPGAYLNFIQKPTCGNSNGSIDIGVYAASVPITSISWNSGQTTPDLEGITAGEYKLTVTDDNGCVFNHTIVLENMAPEQPEICMLTVDTSLVYNLVVWEKDPSQTNLDGYNIYRETSQFGIFEKIAERPYSLESYYQDNDASPVDRSWRYYITSYDACGNESTGSLIHKTIHVVSSTPNAVDYEVHWDNYEGFSYSSVDIFRFDSTNGWSNIANVPFGTNTYLDSPPILTGLDYMVEFNLAFPCTSTKAQDHNSSRSNKTASVFNGGGTTLQIQTTDLGLIQVYPNPAQDEFSIYVENPESVQRYEITDLNGRIISSGIVQSTKTDIDAVQMASGIYLIKIYTNQKVITEKIILN